MQRSNMLSRAMCRLCQCMRGLPGLQSLSLQLDPGYICMANQLFQPTGSALDPDPQWNRLLNFHVRRPALPCKRM